MHLPIYLDHHATTPVDPRVLEAMLPYFTERFGNAASKTHSFGWAAEEAVDRARGQVASLIGARPGEIVFTSGATESLNLALFGVAARADGRPRPIVASPIEHPAVLDPLRRLEKRGHKITWLRPDALGIVGPEAVARALHDDTLLVCVMHANNEIGSVNPIEKIGRVTRERGVLFLSDAAQSAGKLSIDVQDTSVDLLAISAHKLYGPKGVGALYVRGRPSPVRLAPLLHGGGHERGLRPGTVPVPLVVGLGTACQVAASTLEAEASRLGTLARRLRKGIEQRLEGVTLNGHPARRLPGNVHLSFTGIEAEALLLALPEIAVSTGSACTSAVPEPSHVLRGIGMSEEEQRGSVRFGLGRGTREDEIDFTVEVIVRAVTRLRKLGRAHSRKPARSGQKT